MQFSHKLLAKSFVAVDLLVLDFFRVHPDHFYCDQHGRTAAVVDMELLLKDQ